MYQAQITSNLDGQPAGASAAKTISHMLGGYDAEAVDTEQGIWLVSLDSYNESRLEQDGYLGISISGYTVEIEMP